MSRAACLIFAILVGSSGVFLSKANITPALRAIFPRVEALSNPLSRMTASIFCDNSQSLPIHQTP